MYKVLYTNTFLKDVKKLSHEAHREIFSKWLQKLQENPHIGDRLKGKKLYKYWKLGFRFKRVDYRLFYEINEKLLILVLIAAGTRENIYQYVTRRLN